jgi:uridine kinase
MTFDQLAGTIRALGRDESAPRPCVVGIDGMSGAGKSGFALRLAAELKAPVLSTDDLVPGWDGLAESIGLLTDWVLRPLTAGRPARWRRYDWLAGQPGEWVDLGACEYLIVEGCCAGLPEAARYLSYLVWIDAPLDERRRRLARRADWPAYAPHADNWARQEKELQSGALTPERADLVVDNSKTFRDADWTADGFSCRPS